MLEGEGRRSYKWCLTVLMYFLRVGVTMPTLINSNILTSSIKVFILILWTMRTRQQRGNLCYLSSYLHYSGGEINITSRSLDMFYTLFILWSDTSPVSYAKSWCFIIDVPENSNDDYVGLCLLFVRPVGWSNTNPSWIYILGKQGMYTGFRVREKELYFQTG